MPVASVLHGTTGTPFPGFLLPTNWTPPRDVVTSSLDSDESPAATGSIAIDRDSHTLLTSLHRVLDSIASLNATAHACGMFSTNELIKDDGKCRD